jgi:hypothetical protein
VIESNFVGFEGGGFALRTKGGGVPGATWNDYWLCSSAAAPGADCFGTAEPAVRYDSPTWGGFRFETSYGTYDVVPAILDERASQFLTEAFFDHPPTRDSNFWDIAGFYTGDWNSIKISLAAAYTWLEANPLNGGEENITQVGGSVMHKPSGLGVYAMAEWEDVSNASNGKCPGIPSGDIFGGTTSGVGPVSGCLAGTVSGLGSVPDTDMWGIKPFWRKAWMPIGATVLYAEYAKYNDFYGLSLADGVTNGLPNCVAGSGSCIPTGSDMQRWGLGVVQEIDSAAMHVWLRWQHQDLDVSFFDTGTGLRGKQGFEDFNLIQGGGIIFF